MKNNCDIQKFNANVNVIDLYTRRLEKDYGSTMDSQNEGFYLIQNLAYLAKLQGNLKYEANFYSKYMPLTGTVYSKENIEKLYGNTLSTSVSRLERYRSCPFSYYLEYGLNLKERETLRVQSFNTGSFMHETIDQFFEQVNEEGLNLAELEEEQIAILVSKIIDENLSLSKNFVFTATAKYKVLVRRLKKIVSKALKYIIQTIIYSDFSISGTEIEFGKKANTSQSF